MVRRARPHIPLLALLTASGLLSAGEGLRPISRDLLTSIRQQQPMRVAQIDRSLESGKLALGLGIQDGLKAFNQITDGYGRTHVRYHQTYRGVEVYNGTVLGHMDASGRLEAPHATVQKGIDLQSVPLLSEARIQEIVTRNLPQGGKLWPMHIKPMVFPTQYQDGIKVKRGTDGQLTLDPLYSVWTRRKTDPYRWAFQVSTMQATERGLSDTEFILDGQTGEILKKWDGMEHADTPSVGTGHSQYSGTVSLSTTLSGDTNQYSLRDTARPTMPWPDPAGIGFPDWGGVGSQTVCYDLWGGVWGNGSQTGPFTNADDTWGDGQAFVWSTDWSYGQNLNTPHGQTAAVDAHYAIACTWDYYNNVLGRSGGIDGQGGSIISMVHLTDYTYQPFDNAAWSPNWFVMIYGDGAETGSLTSLDVAAHEMSHGVMSCTANLNHSTWFESAGLNEANSDIHATMMKFYQWGSGGTGSVVPDTTTQAPDGQNTPEYLWTMGAQLSKDGTPLRWLYKPSKDGISYDAWFDGVALDDAHYSMGPANRAFYFLSQGASSDTTKDTYSPYLSAGMTGLGNDKAIRIWYNAMATKVTDVNSDYHAIRDAMLASATELYPSSGGTDSAEMAAVKNAFAAINVGAPEGGSEPITVTFPADPDPQFSDYTRIFIWPAGVAAPLRKPTVANATDTSVTWSLGGLSMAFPPYGKIVDGNYIAAIVPNGYLMPIKATSTQDPKEFAVDLVWTANMDCDGDTETDACDLGAMALSYPGMDGYGVYPAANLYGGWTGTDDECCILLLDGFNNAFNQ